MNRNFRFQRAKTNLRRIIESNAETKADISLYEDKSVGQLEKIEHNPCFNIRNFHGVYSIMANKEFGRILNSAFGFLYSDNVKILSQHIESGEPYIPELGSPFQFISHGNSFTITCQKGMAGEICKSVDAFLDAENETDESLHKFFDILNDKLNPSRFSNRD